MHLKMTEGHSRRAKEITDSESGYIRSVVDMIEPDITRSTRVGRGPVYVGASSPAGGCQCPVNQFSMTVCGGCGRTTAAGYAGTKQVASGSRGSTPTPVQALKRCPSGQ